MSPSVAPPFPFYIINKDIIKGSFPFRKTFLTPKLDFEARFRNPDFARPECSADLKSRNRTTETEQTEGEERSACRSPISQPRFQPPRVFRRPEEPEQNHGNGTNRRQRTLCLPKPDFTTSIPTAPRVPPTRRAETESRKRNKPKAKESFPVRRTRQFKDYSIFAPEDFKTRFQTSPSGSSESPLLSPLRHRYCQVNPPTERLNNTHGNICNQVTSVDEFRCFSAFCA